MAYLSGRDPLLNRPETLPTIGDRTHVLDHSNRYRRGITTLDDTLYQSGIDRHVKFTGGHGGMYGRDPYSHSMDLGPGHLGQRKELADVNILIFTIMIKAESTCHCLFTFVYMCFQGDTYESVMFCFVKQYTCIMFPVNFVINLCLYDSPPPPKKKNIFYHATSENYW